VAIGRIIPLDGHEHPRPGRFPGYLLIVLPRAESWRIR